MGLGGWATSIRVGLNYGSRVRRVVFKIIGMHCATCSITVQRALSSVPGVLAVDVSLASDEAVLIVDDRFNYGEALKAVEKAGYDIYREEAYIGLRSLGPGDEQIVLKTLNMPGMFEVKPLPSLSGVKVSYNPLEVDIDSIVGALREAGLDPTEVKAGSVEINVDRRAMEAEFRDLERRLTVAIPLTALVLAITFTRALGQVGLWVSLAADTVVEFYPGWRFIKGAVRAFRNAAANMDTLVALGTLTAYIYSLLYALHMAPGGSFADSVAAIITFILVGRYLEARVRVRASSNISSLASLIPSRARLIEGGQEREVSVNELRPGDRVIVKVGELVPVDGIVDEGKGEVDESAITGEFKPAVKGPGDIALAGGRLISGYLVIRATRIGKYSLVAQAYRLAREAQAARLPIQSLTDKVSSYFTWTIVAVALATLAAWLALGASPYMAILHSVSTLVVACPCALGLATPMAVVAGVDKASAEGLLIKNGRAIESLARVKAIALDKTGTLTEGRPRVVKYVGDLKALALAASAEYPSNHPVARAIVEYAKSMNIEPKPPVEFSQIEGIGVVAVVDGLTVAVGGWGVVKGMEASISDSFMSEAKAIEGLGQSPVFIVIDGSVKGLAAIDDSIRQGAREVINELKSLGIKPIMVTGDSEGPARIKAEELGIDEVYYGLTPSDKVKVIDELRTKHGLVAMVGDGINDAAALGEADVGIAMGAGSDLAKEAGDVVIVSGDVGKLPLLIRLARAIERNIKFNIAYAIAYNLALVPIAAGAIPGLMLRPEFAGLAMALSSLSVTLNAYRVKLAKFNS